MNKQLRNILGKDRKDGQKWLAGKSGVGRTAINNGIGKAIKSKQEGKTIRNSPSVDNAYAKGI